MHTRAEQPDVKPPGIFCGFVVAGCSLDEMGMGPAVGCVVGRGVLQP